MNNEPTCCLSINLQKSTAASAELNHRGEELVFITEPHARNGKILTLDRARGKIFASADPGKRPRAALRVSEGLEPWAAPDFTDGDMATAIVKLQGVSTFVCSLYLDINYEVQKPLFLKLIDHCEAGGLPLVCSMDSNAHSSLWGCSEQNKRGEDLGEVLESKLLLVRNVGATPHLQDQQGTEHY